MKPDDGGALVVELQGRSDTEWRRRPRTVGLRQPSIRAGCIHEHGIALPQIAQSALQDLRRPPDQARIVYADDLAGDGIAVGKAHLDRPAIERHRPGDTRDAFHPVELGILQGLGIVDILDFRVDHPQVDYR